MSKIATYLNEHLVGEVVRAGREISQGSTDGSVLLLEPEMVAHVANTSDIRKIARFSWQLAEKGHVLALTARGYGTDTTGGAIGAGVIIDTRKYLDRIVGIDTKQRLIHVQAGALCKSVNLALSTHKGLTLPRESFDGTSGSVGGAIASGAAGQLSGRYGVIGDVVKQIEVVLANGDVLQTGRQSKRALNTKKGLSTMEGEIYRQIDNLLTDNAELIASLTNDDAYDTSGYYGITQVKQKDGSVDLTPLFVGSQGTLGIITEAILQAQFEHQELTAVIAGYATMEDAQVAVDTAMTSKAVSVEMIDGRLAERATKQGKKQVFAPKEAFRGAIVVALFDDFSEKVRVRTAKKLAKLLERADTAVSLTTESYNVADLPGLWSLLSSAMQPAESTHVVPGAFRGFWLPTVQLDSFLKSLRKVEVEYGVDLPVYVDMRSGFVDLLPEFDVKKVSDRQKLLKLLAAVSGVVVKHDGAVAGHDGDGRLKAVAAQKVVEEDVQQLYDQIKQIFDPHNLLNPGVKKADAAKDVVSQLNAWGRSAV